MLSAATILALPKPARLLSISVPRNCALLTAEMFVAFSKKSTCRAIATEFGQGITEMTTDGRFETMLTEATATWDKDQAND